MSCNQICTVHARTVLIALPLYIIRGVLTAALAVTRMVKFLCFQLLLITVGVSLLPKEQDGFQRGKSTVDQIVQLTQNIEDSFKAKKKAGAIFVNLTAAYDTVWHRGLTCNLLRLLLDKHMVKRIMELVRNYQVSPLLPVTASKAGYGVPQGSFLAPLLFNIYTYDLTSTISRKFAYADDLSFLYSSGNWKNLEGTLSQEMSTHSTYLQTWRLKLSHTKMVTAGFHFNNREAKRELKVYNNNRLLPFYPTPTYLGVKLERSLTFRHHLVALRKKLSSHVTLLRRLVGSGWGAGAKTPCTAALSLIYSTAEYCVPVWCRSAHTRLIDNVFNDALRKVTKCLRPTPTDHLPILSGIRQLSFAKWERPSLWLPVDLWTLIIKWVLRCSKSFKQSCRTWLPRL